MRADLVFRLLGQATCLTQTSALAALRWLLLLVRLALPPILLSVLFHAQPDAAVDVEVLAADLAGGVALTGHVVEVEGVAVVGHLHLAVLPGGRAKQACLDARARERLPVREERWPVLCTC